jgi:Protein of unknown function (DUF1045)
MPKPRYSISYTPPPYSPVAKFGAGVLGYDCFDAVEVPHMALPGIEPAMLSLLTVETRRFGFHAAFVPPFCAGNTGEDKLVAALESLAKRFNPIPIGPLIPDCIEEFIVLRTVKNSIELHALASASLEAFGSLRDPAKGRHHAESNATDFHFHMRLVGPLHANMIGDVNQLFARAFEMMSRDEIKVGTISLMRQDDPAGRFRVLTCTRLVGR